MQCTHASGYGEAGHQCDPSSLIKIPAHGGPKAHETHVHKHRSHGTTDIKTQPVLVSPLTPPRELANTTSSRAPPAFGVTASMFYTRQLNQEVAFIIGANGASGRSIEEKPAAPTSKMNTKPAE